jgi:DnaK suppressor protein
MHGLDPAQLAHLRALLTARLAALDTPPADDHADTGTHALPVTEVETSPADKATVRLLNDLALEAAGHQQASLPLLRHALARFDDDSYGACETCGGDIGFSRLQARPEARLCIACQTRAEKR